MKKQLLFALTLLAMEIVQAQTVRNSVSSFYPSLHTYSTQFKDAFSFRSNCASLASIKQVSAGLFSERRFMLQELSSFSFSFALPTSSGNFGLSGSYFGGQLYNESTISIAHGRKLGEKIDVGVQFNYNSLRASGYGSASTITFDAGAVFHLTETINAGLAIHNPVGMKMGKAGNEKLPASYSMGLGYDVSSQVFIGAEAEKVEDQPVTLNAGIHYLLADKLIARAGISSATAIYYIGFGVQLKSVRLDATASFHPYLGITPGLLLIYSPQK